MIEQDNTLVLCEGCGGEFPAWGLNPVGDELICGSCIIDRDRELTVAPSLTWQDVRGLRGGMLTASDWTQVLDVAEDVREAWKPLREAWRDITDTRPNPEKAYADLKATEHTTDPVAALAYLKSEELPVSL